MCKPSKPDIPEPKEEDVQFLRNRFLDPSSGAELNTIGLGTLRLRPQRAAPQGLGAVDNGGRFPRPSTLTGIGGRPLFPNGVFQGGRRSGIGAFTL